jgi:hypothetical protein
MKIFPAQLLFLPIILGILIVPNIFSNWSLDAFNLVKLMTVSVLAISSIIFLLKSKIKVNFKDWYVFSLLLFMVYLLLIFFKTESDRYHQIYGSLGRNTGLLAYLSFCILALMAYFTINNHLENFNKILILSGVISCIYGIIQATKLTNLWFFNGDIYGMFGNTNFYSAFLGIIGSIICSYIFYDSLNIKLKLNLFLLFSLIIYLIFLSKSIQGFIIIVIGNFFIILCKVSLKLKQILLGTFIPLIICYVSGLLNFGPLKSIIYDDSVRDRKYCWESAIKILKEFPVTGIGFDNYENFYRSARTIEAIKIKGTDQICDTAHSVPLDISIIGGVPLLVIYSLILLLCLKNVIKIIFTNANFNPHLAALISAWIGYQSQSLISINQIGLATIGWILTGAVAGIQSENSTKFNFKPKQKTYNLKFLILLFLGCLSAIPTLMPPIIELNRNQTAYKSKDAGLLLKTSLEWPYDKKLMIIASQQLSKSGYEKESLKILTKISMIYPNYFNTYPLILINSESTEQNKIYAKEKIEFINNILDQ